MKSRFRFSPTRGQEEDFLKRFNAHLWGGAAFSSLLMKGWGLNSPLGYYADHDPTSYIIHLFRDAFDIYEEAPRERHPLEDEQLRIWQTTPRRRITPLDGETLDLIKAYLDERVKLLEEGLIILEHTFGKTAHLSRRFRMALNRAKKAQVNFSNR